MKTGTVVALGAVALVGLVIWARSDPSPPQNLAPERTVQAQELVEAYAGNEMAAERDFENTPIRIQGEVYSVTDGGSVLLDAGPGKLVGLSMIEESKAALVNVSKGQKFSADCQKTMFIFSTITPMHCRPSPSEPSARTSPQP